MAYIGGGLLETGIEVDGSDLQRIADRHPGELNRSIRNAQVDDRAITPDGDAKRLSLSSTTRHTDRNLTGGLFLYL